MSGEQVLKGFCRDCLTHGRARRCAACGSPRIIRDNEIFDLSIAHIDCDAFYASVEKRDDPTIADKPVIVGGGRRGVVSAACYIARTYGIHSAMPMYKALKACPDVVVVRPDMKKYVKVGHAVRDIMRTATPLVEPLSLDEAFLDLTGTARLHGRSPAETLAAMALKIEKELRINVSIGLSYNKFLAKVASDLDKPRGFAVISRAGARDFLASQPVAIIWGAGKALQRKLAADGITRVAQLQTMELADLMARYGAMGKRMYDFSRGQDSREVNPRSPTKSISSETTFADDISELATLEGILWRQSVRVADRMKSGNYAGKTVTLKLRTTDFKLRTRAGTLANPTQLADVIYHRGRELLLREVDGTRFRLLGIGLSALSEGDFADPLDLGDPDGQRRAAAERAVDKLRSRFGEDKIGLGRGIKPEK